MSVVDDEPQSLPLEERPSPIEGIGVFATGLIKQGTVLPDPPQGYSLNHSCTHNIGRNPPVFIDGCYVDNGPDPLWALRDILPGEELTMDYTRGGMLRDDPNVPDWIEEWVNEECNCPQCRG